MNIRTFSVKEDGALETILGRIFETDKAARDKVAAGKKRLDSINEEIAAEKAEFDRQLKADALKAIAETQAQTEKILDCETERIDRHFEKTKADLEKAYAENGARWAEEIFREAVK